MWADGCGCRVRWAMREERASCLPWLESAAPAVRLPGGGGVLEQLLRSALDWLAGRGSHNAGPPC